MCFSLNSSIVYYSPGLVLNPVLETNPMCVTCPITRTYGFLLRHLITNERNTKIGAEQRAKDATLGKVILSVFEDGVGTAKHHFSYNKIGKYTMSVYTHNTDNMIKLAVLVCFVVCVKKCGQWTTCCNCTKCDLSNPQRSIV